MRSRISRHLAGLLGAPQAVDAGLDEALTITAAGEAPLPPPELNGRDYAIFLLRLGAEVEHGLMVQYLYAAYSLDGSRLSNDDDRAEVRAWQETLLGVAKEEMAHLVTVQNLLTALSAPLNFNREEFPHDTVLYPFGFDLRPLGLDTLAAYVCAESPADWGDVAEEQEIKDAAKAGTGAVVNRVGRLYAELHRVLGDPAIIADDDFDAASTSFQASWDEWGRGYREGARGTLDSVLPRVAQPELLILRVGSRADALQAVEMVGEQGEGLELSEVSHFLRFVDIYRGMKRLGVENVVRPLARNPTTDLAGPDVVAPGAADDEEGPALQATAIRNPQARLWAHLFNVRYRKLLVSLSHAFELSDDPADAGALGPRGALVHRAFSEMYNLRAIAGRLVALPVDGASPAGPFAGPPFQIAHTLMLPRGEAARWRLHRDILDASGAMIAQLRDAAGEEGAGYLTALAELDATERAQVERLIKGATTVGGGDRTP